MLQTLLQKKIVLFLIGFVSVAGFGITSQRTQAFTTQQPVLKATPATVTAGDEVTFTITNGPAYAAFCIITTSESEGSGCPEEVSDWQELNQNGSGSVTFVVGDDEITEQETFTYVAFIRLNAIGDPLMDFRPTAEVIVKPQSTAGGGGSGGSGGSGSSGACQTILNTPPGQRPVLAEGSNRNTNAALTCALQLLNNPKVFPPSGAGLSGIDDPQFFAQVEIFQSFNSLESDGIIGSNTWTKMFEQAGLTPDSSSSGTPGAPGTPGGQNPSGTPIASGLDCASVGLVEKNGLCFPKQEGPQGQKGGLVGCDTVGQCLSVIIKILLTIAGIIAVLFIIVGGYQYITSAGNESRAEAGKKTLVNALIGLAAIILAYTIVTIITNSLTRGSIF